MSLPAIGTSPSFGRLEVSEFALRYAKARVPRNPRLLPYKPHCEDGSSGASTVNCHWVFSISPRVRGGYTTTQNHAHQAISGTKPTCHSYLKQCQKALETPKIQGLNSGYTGEPWFYQAASLAVRMSGRATRNFVEEHATRVPHAIRCIKSGLSDL